MAGYSKVRSLVTGVPGLDTFIREVRTSLAELQPSGGLTAADPLAWDSHHALAFSLKGPGPTFPNEGSGGSFELKLGGGATPRTGFPSPIGGAVEFPSETTTPGYLVGAGAFPTRPNNFSVEILFFTHFAPYTLSPWDGYVCLWKKQYFHISSPALFSPPSTINAAVNTAASTVLSTTPARQVQIPTGQWNHVMFTASSSDGKRLYMNGALVGANTSTADAYVNNNDWYLGGADSNLYKFYGAACRFAYSDIVRPQSYAYAITKTIRGW